MGKCIEHKAGDRFGSWTIIERGELKNNCLWWICKCECGLIKSVLGSRLRTGDSLACKSCSGKRTSSKRCGSQHPLWTGYGEISGNYWSHMLRHAKNRGYVVEITIEEAWTLFLAQDRKCALSGVELKFGKDQTASLDRIDSSIGYVTENIQWVHKDVNWMKGEMPDADFISWCRLVADRQFSVI